MAPTPVEPKVISLQSTASSEPEVIMDGSGLDCKPVIRQTTSLRCTTGSVAPPVVDVTEAEPTKEDAAQEDVQKSFASAATEKQQPVKRRFPCRLPRCLLPKRRTQVSKVEQKEEPPTSPTEEARKFLVTTDAAQTATDLDCEGEVECTDVEQSQQNCIDTSVKMDDASKATAAETATEDKEASTETPIAATSSDDATPAKGCKCFPKIRLRAPSCRLRICSRSKASKSSTVAPAPSSDDASADFSQATSVVPSANCQVSAGKPLVDVPSVKGTPVDTDITGKEGTGSTPGGTTGGTLDQEPDQEASPVE